MDTTQIEFFDESDLLDRLTNGLLDFDKEVLFVVGAPLTATYNEQPGVIDVAGVTDLIRELFKPTNQLEKLDQLLRSSDNAYQEAFRFLKGRRGPTAAEKIVKCAVLAAHDSYSDASTVSNKNIPDDSVLTELDSDIKGWSLSPGVEALGQLAAINPDIFGRQIITSNFDPLIEVSIQKAKGQHWQTLLYTDGDLSQSKADGCQVIHIHGYWVGADCLHTGNQLTQRRPALKSSINELLKNKVVVVIGYGGWKDIFTEALRSFVVNPAEFPEIIWTFYSDHPDISDDLQNLLNPGINRNRVSLYKGINCHTFLPNLYKYWNNESKRTLGSTKKQRLKEKAKEPIQLPRYSIPKLVSDRPPSFDIWVGRNKELDTLKNTNARVITLTGIGGEGKSVLAAHYLDLVRNGNTQYTHIDWRDCKEEGDRIRTQIVSIIERLSNSTISSEELSSTSDGDLIDILIELSIETSTVFVLDNVDYYVELVAGKFIGILHELVEKFAKSTSNSRLIITCRPKIKYSLSSFVSMRLEGLTESEVIELYERRVGVGKVSKATIKEVCKFTKGHAFWNDLLAAQLARRRERTLEKMFEDIKRGDSEAPDVLSSIWDQLHQREQLVLQVLSETVRPETQETIKNMVLSEMKLGPFLKAMKSLAALNLLVVKPEANSLDLYDLHPLVRQFVHTNFGRSERSGFIKIVLNQYAVIISGIGKMLGIHLPQSLLERYSQKAELEIEAGMIEEAFKTLSTSEEALIGSGNVEEYIRVANLLLNEVDWETQSTSIKNFDSVVIAYIECLTLHSRYEEADVLLKKFEENIPKNTARYIRYCNIKSHSFWLRENFKDALHWGEVGVKLKEDSQLDTLYDCSHNLALAQRDSGNPKTALQFFLKKYKLSDLVDPMSNKAEEDGATLGNVGRCLQMMGDHKEALICLKKSARSIEKDNGRTRTTNQSWARHWIADSLKCMEAPDLAYAFYADAARIIESTAPSRADSLRKEMDKLPIEEEMDKLSGVDITRRVDAWIKSN